jgi:hypothetical protein
MQTIDIYNLGIVGEVKELEILLCVYDLVEFS